MMISLSLAVWEIGADKVHFLNIGDSRIYVAKYEWLKPADYISFE
jgi:hypothetical protein